MNVTSRKALLLTGLTVLLVTGGAVAVVLAARANRPPSNNPGGAHLDPNDDDHGDDQLLTVKTIRPKRNHRQLVRSVTQPAYVQPLHRVDLFARVAGPIKMIEKNLGDPVTAGEVLAELDVPDLEFELAHKAALEAQAEQDARMAEANVKIMMACEREAKSQIAERESQVRRADANKRFREAEFRRFKDLVAEKGALPIVLDERMRELEGAIADWQTSQAAVETARANSDEFTAKVEAARVDVDVKKARVAVARAEKAKAEAIANFAKIRAPFNGAIAARHFDPGSFVQNASTGNPVPVLTVVRTDIVTIVMWVPEKDAHYVVKGTEAIFRLDALGEREFRTKVTRTSNWLDPTKSRDMRIEVDLPNPRAPGTPVGATTGLLKAGMYGSMTLILQKFDNVVLVPTSTLCTRGRTMYMCEVKEGVAHLVPVVVQLEDGIQAKIARRVERTNTETGETEEVFEDLTGDEEIVRSGQGEIVEGQAVKTVHVDW
ncbi:hypothetical protein AYO44_10715 [Planctomycetaceae bacterium SCGC AG-212-F19]|nr:hypothetical protein AYO44_10715 [Planctomycetaceae bacterium SCGC AG-212-F19]